MQKDRTTISRAAGALVLLAAGALLLVGCNVGGAGIFYTLEKATVQTTSGIGDKPTAGSMALISGTPGVYYVAAGTVYSAAVASPLSWKKVNAPANATSDICTSLTSNGTTLYAVFYNPNADGTTSYYLYSATVSGSAPDSSPSWAPVAGFDSNSSFTVQQVYSVNGNVLVMVMDNPPSGGSSAGLYSLYQVTGAGATATSTQILSGLQDPPSAGAWDGTDYWFIGGYSSAGTAGGPSLYSGSTLTGLTQVSASNQPSLPTGMVYRGIYYSSVLKTLFLSTSQVNNEPGRVYADQNGGGWTKNSIISWPSGTAQTGLNGFDEYEVSSTSDAILVGADINGYFEIDVNPTTFSASTASTTPIALGQPGNTAGTVTAGADYVSTTLASSHILGFFNNPGSGTATAPEYFFALSQNGLWLNAAASSGGRTWSLQ